MKEEVYRKRCKTSEELIEAVHGAWENIRSGTCAKLVGFLSRAVGASIAGESRVERRMDYASISIQ